MSVPAVDRGKTLRECSDSFRFAAAVAAFGMKLRDSPHAGALSYEDIRRVAQTGLGAESNERLEFVDMVDQTARLCGSNTEKPELRYQ